MKIILAPSKTQDIRQIDKSKIEGIQLSERAEKRMRDQESIRDKLVRRLQLFDEKTIASKMKIKGKLLDKVIDDYKHFYKNDGGNALFSYTGTVFKELEFNRYSSAHYNYINKYVMILSALYGPIPALYTIKPYRLDMKMSLFENSLYKIWEEAAKAWFQEEELIIDLASTEFSKMVCGNKVEIVFLQNVKGDLKKIAFHSKQGRGYMLNYIIKNQLETLEELRSFASHGYTYSHERSSMNKLVYIRL